MQAAKTIFSMLMSRWLRPSQSLSPYIMPPIHLTALLAAKVSISPKFHRALCMEKIPHTKVRYSGIKSPLLRLISSPSTFLAVFTMSKPNASSEGCTLSGCLHDFPSIHEHLFPLYHLEVVVLLMFRIEDVHLGKLIIIFGFSPI